MSGRTRRTGSMRGSEIRIRLLVVLVIICIQFVIDSSATRCIAKDSCTHDVECGICDKVESIDSCTQINFCDWTSTCEPAPGCSWFNNATCTSVTSATTSLEQEEMCALTQSSSVCMDMDFCEWRDATCISAQVEQQEMCALTQSSSVCLDMEFCEWKDDCRECSKLTVNRDCVNRDFCMWDLGTLPAYPITSADIVFVVASVMCEVYTTVRLVQVVFLYFPNDIHYVPYSVKRD